MVWIGSFLFFWKGCTVRLPGHGANMVQWKEPRFWRQYIFFLARREQSMVVKSMHSGVGWPWSQCWLSHQNTTWAEPPEIFCPLWRNWGDPHLGRLVWQGHRMAPPGTQSATVAETVANLLHSLFSRSSADLLGMSGYIFQNSCVCAGKALHTVDLPRERCHKDSWKFCQGFWLLIS